MKQRYREITHELALEAVSAFLDGKWSRRDVLRFVEKNTGVSRRELYADRLTNSMEKQNEVAEALALYLEELVDEITAGEEPEDVEAVTVRQRRDGMTGKVRSIANLCISHQLLGHLAAISLMPLFHARITPWQHASIPGRGQTRLKKQIQKMLLSQKLGIKYHMKTDIVGAYGHTMYADVIGLIRKEIPAAVQLITVLEYLATLAPDGHLIIGGYLDAWLFNFAMSYAVREAMKEGRWRRGKFRRHIQRIVAYMDDFTLLGQSKTGVRNGMRALENWLLSNLGLELKQTSAIIRFCDVAEERRRRHESRPAKRGCPSVDVGGYMIHRTYVTMRPRVAKRVRRDFSRAAREIDKTGTLRPRRAASLSARYGSAAQSTSTYFLRKYRVYKIMKIARAVNACRSRLLMLQKRKEWERYAFEEYGCCCPA